MESRLAPRQRSLLSVGSAPGPGHPRVTKGNYPARREDRASAGEATRVLNAVCPLGQELVFG